MRRFATKRTRLDSIWRARERVKLPAYHVAHRLHHRPGTDLEDSDAPRRIARRDPSPSASGCTLSNATTGTVGIVTPDQGPSAASCHRLRTCGRPFYLFFVGPSPCRTCATRTQCDQDPLVVCSNHTGPSCF
jgi:hypothetical protein